MQETRSAEPVAVVLRAPANQVSRKAIAFWTVRAGAGWLALAAIQLAWMLLDEVDQAHIIGLIATGVLAIGHLAVMPQWRFRVHRWEITEAVVYAQSGWFNKERRIAPVSRIQTVDTARGPFEQLFGLTNVKVTTASAHGPVHIHGLEAGDAQRIVAELAANTQATIGDAT